jgi:hypothetical protein
MQHSPAAVRSKALSLPVSDSTVDVHFINTTTDICCPTDFLLGPAIQGHENLNLPTFGFLLENKRLNKALLFDLGCRKDWWNLSPAVQESMQKGIVGLQISKGVHEILEEGDFDLNRLNFIVLRYYNLYSPILLA